MITIITATTECKKCVACLEIISRLQERYPGRIELRKVPHDDPSVQDIGVVMPPTLIVNDLMISAGRVPLEGDLDRLIQAELGEEATA